MFLFINIYLGISILSKNRILFKQLRSYDIEMQINSDLI